MSNDKEKISAYLDNDLSPAELSALEPVDSGAASRYQLMGEALRGRPSDAAMIDVSAQVREALKNESLAPAEPVRTQLKQPRQPLFDFSAWFRPLGGLAVAASVALVMVAVVTQIESPSGQDGLIADAGNTSVNIPDNIEPITVAVEDVQPQNQQAVNLDAYLAEHAEFASQDTLQGRMPYVRAVSYESNQ